jgi:hypothetical protein
VNRVWNANRAQVICAGFTLLDTSFATASIAGSSTIAAHMSARPLVMAAWLVASAAVMGTVRTDALIGIECAEPPPIANPDAT